MLGRIVGDTLEQARCELTPLGVAVSECIRYIEGHGAKHGHNLQVIAKEVMPDHVHFILYVRERLTDCKLGDIIRGFKQGCNKALRSAIEAQEAATAHSGTGLEREGEGSQDLGADENDKRDDERDKQDDTNKVRNEQDEAKSDDAKHDEPNNSERDDAKRSERDEPSSRERDIACLSSLTEGVSRPVSLPATPPATQRGYRQPPLPISSPRMLRDHALFEADFDETILRRRGQLKTMIRYVHNNPKHRWLKQRHPNLLIPMRGIMIAGKVYDAIGNITLLGMERHQVWVRSRWDETTRRNYQNDCILKARQYHTLVSPFISPHEAAVRDVALKEGHPVIVLVDNGFSDFTQCPGNLYDYCVKGQVLVIVPSELPHISNKKTISRQECMMLNERASEIAKE